jgi:serine/threonine-protein kinase
VADEKDSPASVHARADALIGRTISERYRITEPIAAGGIGAVFKGEHLHMRKHVAIKILHAETEGLEGLAQQFEREAVAGAHLDHPNIASATDFGELEDGSFFLVLEYVKGEPLDRILKKGPMSVDRVLRLARQMADALAAVHEMGMVHRDIKAANVMLVSGEEEQAKLIDFGFAKVPMDRLELSREDDPLAEENISEDTVFGTIHYLAPEAMKGMTALDARSDLYALGIIMYEMLTGTRPFDGDSYPIIFKQHRETPPPPFIERAPMIPVPAALEAVVMKLLAKDPDQRYQSGKEVVEALDRVAVAKKLEDRPQIDLSDIDIPPPRRSRFGQLLMLLLVLGGLGATVWFVPSVRAKAIELGLPLPSAGADDEEEGAPRKQEVDGLGAGAWTAKLLDAPKSRDWGEGAKAVRALAELDDTALSTKAMRNAALAVALGVASVPKHAAKADATYDALAGGFGSDGLDVLYTIVETQQPRQPAARRALSTLQKPSALEDGTPALRIAVELRNASCEEKAGLFERAASDGDLRALKVLKPLKLKPCPKGPKDPCCFRHNKALANALSQISARLAK